MQQSRQYQVHLFTVFWLSNIIETHDIHRNTNFNSNKLKNLVWHLFNTRCFGYCYLPESRRCNFGTLYMLANFGN